MLDSAIDHMYMNGCGYSSKTLFIEGGGPNAIVYRSLSGLVLSGLQRKEEGRAGWQINLRGLVQRAPLTGLCSFHTFAMGQTGLWILKRLLPALLHGIEGAGQLTRLKALSFSNFGIPLSSPFSVLLHLLSQNVSSKRLAPKFLFPPLVRDRWPTW